MTKRGKKNHKKVPIKKGKGRTAVVAGHRCPAALEVAEGGGAAIWAGGGSGWSWVMVEGRREVLNGKVWQNERLTIAYADI